MKSLTHGLQGSEKSNTDELWQVLLHILITSDATRELNITIGFTGSPLPDHRFTVSYDQERAAEGEWGVMPMKLIKSKIENSKRYHGQLAGLRFGGARDTLYNGEMPQLNVVAHAFRHTHRT